MDWSVEEAHKYEDTPRVEGGSANLHRQMDPEDSVFSKREALPPWAVEAPRGNGLAAHADQNSSRTGINRIDYQTRDGVENCRGRILFDRSGENDNRPARRHVPLGEASWAARDCGSTDSTKAEVMGLDTSLSCRVSEA